MNGTHKFPEVKPGGSLMVAYQVKNRRVLVIGGGEVAAGRIFNLLCADASVTCISPKAGLNAEVQHRVATGAIEHVDRNFVPEDLDDPAVKMVLVAIDDPVASTDIYRLCHEKRIPANIADVPPECDFYFGSVHRDGPLQVMVSTNGNGPKLASIVRKEIAATLPANLGAAIQKVGILRRKLRKIAPEPEQGPKRMSWMSRVSEKWTLKDLCEMSETDMESLLKYFASNKVPSYEEVAVGKGEEGFGFDGSFGFTVGV